MGIQGMELCAVAVVILLFIAVLKQFGILEPISVEDGGDGDFELSAVRHQPEGLEQLQAQTKFTKKELQSLYRGFKTECPSGLVDEETFKLIYSQFFPQGGELGAPEAGAGLGKAGGRHSNPLSLCHPHKMSQNPKPGGCRRAAASAFQRLAPLSPRRRHHVRSLLVQRLRRGRQRSHLLSGNAGDNEVHLRHDGTLHLPHPEGQRARGARGDVLPGGLLLDRQIAEDDEGRGGGPGTASVEADEPGYPAWGGGCHYSEGDGDVPAERLLALQKMDRNRDGVVTFEEFVETCQKDENIMSSMQIFENTI
ncbi:calsenilin isoform X3 [Apteryx mantelli]|uniref:Calsenilin isoform X3 n=1 Tax=Apteryx mantelli TaxID=2696672 RepID=A0ABM4FU80_9AVES